MKIPNVQSLGINRGGAFKRKRAALFDDGIMPVFCPTGQRHRGLRKPLMRAAQAIEMIITGYCAWGCFSDFCLGRPKRLTSPRWGEVSVESAVLP
ncbi:hypothetical protein [Bradyrhizobium sp. McL0616]|uniref:hypothetical protein n=1 Tax=Bradyrhizobium sp. McL0616 TaxID=3415674 RepID=UPI003CF77937